MQGNIPKTFVERYLVFYFIHLSNMYHQVPSPKSIFFISIAEPIQVLAFKKLHKILKTAKQTLTYSQYWQPNLYRRGPF